VSVQANVSGSVGVFVSTLAVALSNARRWRGTVSPDTAEALSGETDAVTVTLAELEREVEFVTVSWNV